MTQPTERAVQAYEDAQRAMAMLKSAVYRALLDAGGNGLSNAQIGKRLGIHTGHKGHEGHIPRTLLAIMEGEHVVEQDTDRKLWRLSR
ncbi:MAG: hypothetical protein F4W89_02210 [Acidobacteria bacterium]|nr:hypothetical protein [Acidobacteriota bacterium]